MTSVLLVALADAARQQGRLVPELEQLTAVCGEVARSHRRAQARLADLERRAAGGGPRLGVVAPAQPGSPSEPELPVGTVAGRLGVTPQRVRQLAASGRLTGRKAAGCWWFTPTNVDRYAREQTSGR